MLGSFLIFEHWAIEALVAQDFGELAQLVECCDRTAEVRGSNPLFSILVSFMALDGKLELPEFRCV